MELAPAEAPTTPTETSAQSRGSDNAATSGSSPHDQKKPVELSRGKRFLATVQTLWRTHKILSSIAAVLGIGGFYISFDYLYHFWYRPWRRRGPRSRHLFWLFF